jgi:hypothetical protein
LVKLTVKFAESEPHSSQIEHMRQAYFEQHGIKTYPPQANAWLVCVDKTGRVYGCLGYSTERDALCVTDLYADHPAASKYLLDHIHEAADLCQIPIMGVTHSPIIVDYAIKRGWQVAGTAIVRHPTKREDF